MEVIGFFGRNVESGKIIISTGIHKAIEVYLQGKKIDVNVEDKRFLKRAIGLLRKTGNALSLSSTEGKKDEKGEKSGGSLGMLRMFAETLQKEDLTLTVSYKGSVVVTLGAEARSSLLQIITKTRAVAINDMAKLIGMLV